MVEPGVSQDGEHPGLHIAIRPKCLPRTDRPHVCFLHQVLCVAPIASKDERVTIQAVDMFNINRVMFARHNSHPSGLDKGFRLDIATSAKPRRPQPYAGCLSLCSACL